MKVTKTWKGWAVERFENRADLLGWIEELNYKDEDVLIPLSRTEARRRITDGEAWKVQKTPKRCTLTVTYEVEE